MVEDDDIDSADVGEKVSDILLSPSLPRLA